MKTRVEWTPQHLRSLRELCATKSAQHIADLTGHTRSSVYAKIHILGLKATKHGELSSSSRYSAWDISMVRQLAADGMRISLIAIKMEMPTRTVWNVVNGVGRPFG